VALALKGPAGPDYGNWVPVRLIYAPLALGGLCLGLALILPARLLTAVLLIVAAALLACAAYFIYAHLRFSPLGGGLQARISALLLDRLYWDGRGRALDIGCGNGWLSVALAKKFPQAQVQGLDYWGRSWGYSQAACRRNARLEGMAERVFFQRASAAALPFAEGTFDLAVSNLVFHEVRGVKDKRELVREALRVVRPGGRFAFQDLFLVKSFYGRVDDLLVAMRGWGVREVNFIDTSAEEFIPRALRLPFMVGRIGVIWGVK